MYFHLPCLPARSPHWPLLFRAPADLVSQQRLNLNSFSSFPKPSLTSPHAAFYECIRNTLPPTDSAPLPSLRKAEHWTSWWTGTFFSEAASVCCCSKCTQPEQGDAIWSPSMETPAWADGGATGLTGLLFKWTADLFNHLFWIVLDTQLKTERNILGRWQCIHTMLCSAYSLQSFLWQYKKNVELLLFAVISVMSPSFGFWLLWFIALQNENGDCKTQSSTT